MGLVTTGQSKQVQNLTDWGLGRTFGAEGAFSWTGFSGNAGTVIYSIDLTRISYTQNQNIKPKNHRNQAQYSRMILPQDP